MERVKELAGLCETYGVARLLLTVKSPLDREALRQSVRAENFLWRYKIKLMPSWNRSLEWVKEKEKAPDFPLRPTVVDVCGETRDGGRHWLEIKRVILENGEPVVFRFLGKENSELEESDGCFVLPMFPFEGGKLSLYGEFAAVLDRFLGSK